MTGQTAFRRNLDLLWILPGAACAAASVGNATVPIAPWLAMTFTLRFARRTPARLAAPLGLTAWALAYVVGWKDVLPFHGWIAIAAPGLAGAAAFSPFLVDKALSPRLGRWSAWLVLPCAWVTLELALGGLGYGSWGALAYTQPSSSPLTQSVALLGMAAPIFLIAASASAANAAWENPRRGAPVALVAGGLLAGVLLLGGLRLTHPPRNQQTVRAAGVVVDNMAVFRDTWGPLSYGRPLSGDQARRARPAVERLQAELFERSVRAAKAGAKIIVWSEANALAFEMDEASLIVAGKAFAAEHRVYLFLSAAIMRPGERLAENVVIVIDDQGRVADRYVKSHPTPGEASRPGGGRLRTLDTPFGRLAWAICYDFDYPGLIRQAGAARADILIDPSWDSAGMSPLHSQMAALRAVETGASVFRPTNGGLGVAVDGYGRVLSTLPARTFDRDLVAELPTTRATAPYSQVGDGFAWACLLALLGLFGRGFLPRGHSKRPQAP